LAYPNETLQSLVRWKKPPTDLLGRVTRLGEFSPLGRFFTLGCFLKNDKSCTNCWAHFFHGTSYVTISRKMGWATFWPILSQANLVTLLFANFLSLIFSNFRRGFR
jgi:hypothetical protein